MMKTLKLTAMISLLFAFSGLKGQVVDRYPVIQCPTETSVTIAWRTQAAGTGTLHWGLDSANLSQSLTGASTQKHNFTLTNLAPNTRYYYRVETSSGYASNTESFFTAKPIGDTLVRFLHYGDCGYDNSVQNGLAAVMEGEEVDFAVVAGDVDQGDGSNYDDIFFGVYKNMLARDCHYTAIGNHDIIYDNGNTYLDAFYLPTNNPQQSERYYTFTWGNTKFICLDSNIDYSPGSDQHNFMLDEMKCNDRQWLFVFFHHPPWTNAWDPSYYIPFQPYYEYDGNDDMRTDLVPYFEQYGVDFVLNGHAHCYQRGEMNGVNYVISGGAGTATLDDHTCNTFPNYNACSPNLQVEIYQNHYVRFEVEGDSVYYFAINGAGQVIDSVAVGKPWIPYSPQIAVSHPSQPGAADGSISVQVSGPHPPYSISWSTGDTVPSLSGLSPGAYVLTITNAYGCARSDTIQLSPAVSVSPASDPRLVVYPNPAAESFRIQWSGNGEVCYSLINSTGSLIREGCTHAGVAGISGEGLSSGIWFLRWESPESSGVTKLIRY